MTFGEMATDLQRLLGTDLQYYAGHPTVDTGTVDFAVERRRLLNWAIRTTSKLCFLYDPAVTFVPVESQAFYALDPSTGQGLRQEVYLGAATAGTFTLTFDGQTTAAINWNASASTVQTALENLSNLIAGDVTVSTTTLGYRLAFANTYASPPVPSVSITSSLTATGTPSVLRQAFGKRVVKCFGFQLDDIVVNNDRGYKGLWNAAAFERVHSYWRSDAAGTPVRVVDRGHQVQLHYTPDASFLTASAGNCFALAQVLLDDMQTDGGDDNSIVDLDSTLHEGIVQLAMFRAADPITDEDGALRRLQSANARWQAEVTEIRKRNRNAVFETLGAYPKYRRVPA